MQCPAGDNFGYIDYQGNFYPCTSLLTFKLGNLTKAKLTDLWQNSISINLLRKLKSRKKTELINCRNCFNLKNCEGGCRGDALYYNNDIDGLPSRCPQNLKCTL
jgi:radical SAM protein with 4Fe4S-binding SPASM domain